MELILSKRDFLRGLTRTHAVAERKGSMPILSNVLLATEGSESLRLAATDLYLGVHTQIEARVLQQGSIAVAARTAFDIVKNLPDSEIHWTVANNHSVEIRCGKVRYRVAGMPGDDFPPLPSAEGASFATLPAELLQQLLALTHYSMSSDETRPHLIGALLQIQGQTLRVVTTDGHRLSKAEAQLTQKAPPEMSMMVPAKGIQELRRLLDESKATRSSTSSATAQTTNVDLQIATLANHAFFQRPAASSSGQGVQLSVRLGDDAFPPYEKVIPQRPERRARLHRNLWIEALRRVSLVAADKTGGVRLQFSPGLLRIASENPEVGEGSEELEIDYAEQPVSIGFNARYLIEALAALPHDEVVLEFSGELDPGVIRPVGDGIDFLGVVMPMRI